ncbi:uncharacterized protein E0L32_012039 [Thyridium curvatum]|uniref:Conserved oligomeric Golgi complex subunit 4 n=1 Tax=Thyridium curvatum TaxID=1093900 RepID=A0A507BLT0_9PEZI|nr:uncharacterized protein E0L32_012039 [Thyridium curvatum]TPX17660.1 hypothetical protein E0L32_012039 [Thyridium curvatum]
MEIRDVSTREEVEAALQRLHNHEASLTRRLETVRSSLAELDCHLGKLDSLRANLGSLVIATRTIANATLSNAASTVAKFSSRIDRLDLEERRVDETLEVVELVAELKACVHGVVGSMGAPQDWDSAARYLSRTAKIPEEIIRGGFSAAVVPSTEVPDPPWDTLQEAKHSLCRLFVREFQRAVRDGDEAKVTRYFKLFPLIGMRDVGLDIYGRHICQAVAERGRKELEGTKSGQVAPLFYSNALTKLFRHIVHIIEIHGPLVEHCYGSGQMVKVIERLQDEADIQGGMILDAWSEAEDINRRLTSIKSYPFSFLLKSFLVENRAVPRTHSPASNDTSQDKDYSPATDAKDVDRLLGEMATMLTAWSHYMQYVASKCKTTSESSEGGHSPIPTILLCSKLYRKTDEILATPFKAMTTFFLRRSIEKSFELNEFPSISLKSPVDTSSPLIITAVDDVVFIVDTIIRRIISTSHIAVATSLIPVISRVLETDFVGIIHHKMSEEAYPRAPTSRGNPPETKIIMFIVLMNSLDAANDYLLRIVNRFFSTSNSPADGSSMRSIPPPDCPLGGAFTDSRDLASVAAALRTLVSSFRSRTTELLASASQALFTHAVKPRLRSAVSDAFRDSNYGTEEEMTGPEDEDEQQEASSVTSRFEQGWEQCMRPLHRVMTSQCYTALLALAAAHLAQALEKRFWNHTKRISELGLIRLERDYSGIIGVVARRDYSARQAFVRVSQMLVIVNLEDDEWEELKHAGERGHSDQGVVWVLDQEERVALRKIVK